MGFAWGINFVILGNMSKEVVEKYIRNQNTK